VTALGKIVANQIGGENYADSALAHWNSDPLNHSGHALTLTDASARCQQWAFSFGHDLPYRRDQGADTAPSERILDLTG
jgi:hypothetical protein